jgi:hypothetical protein
MARVDSERKEEHPIFTYSLNLRIASEIVFILLFTLLIAYVKFVENQLFGIQGFLILGLGLIALYRDWRKPLRKIRFLESHFEVSGWKVNRKASYEELEYLSKQRRLLGDFRSDSAVWFSIKDDPNDFMVPNRKVGKPKVELYSWLLQKNPKAAQTL